MTKYKTECNFFFKINTANMYGKALPEESHHFWRT